MQAYSYNMAFNAKHGTDMYVYVLKELIQYYSKHGSEMFVAFLDASRASDRLNHYILLYELKAANVLMYIIRLIAFWFSK